MVKKAHAELSNIDLARILNFGDHELVVRSAREALRSRPSDPKTWQLLAVGLATSGKFREAEAALTRALALRPGDPELLQNQAAMQVEKVKAASEAVMAALERGDSASARQLARCAVKASPGQAALHSLLSAALLTSSMAADAVSAARQAVALDPGHLPHRLNLAACLQAAGRNDEALAVRREIFERDPSDVENCCRLAQAAADRGDATLAAHYCRQGREGPPPDLLLFSHWLYYMTLDARTPSDQLAHAHRAYGRRIELAMGPPARHHPPRPAQSRCLRLGFVSADLRQHPVAGFIAPVWAALDRRRVEVWVYAAGGASDDVTVRLKGLADHWCDAQALTDAELAHRIQADGVDVLFDLSGHTHGHRLPCFALRPAPVQVTWIGYPNTTGLAAMDYALCDRFNAPPGLYEHTYVEKFARIPCSGTFEPPSGLPDVMPLPALKRGRVCFGSFNVLRKIGPEVLDAWARILLAVPAAELLIGHVAEQAQADWLQREFEARGVDSRRLRLHPPLPMADYLALHAEVDILLDTWPYTGGTTTNYALAMGVPVLTLRGPSRAHCQAAGVLGRIGLDDWVAADVDDYVARATRWSGELGALSDLRSGLRDRWQFTPLRQPASVARGLERAVQLMWMRWCEGLPPEHFEVESVELEAQP